MNTQNQNIINHTQPSGRITHTDLAVVPENLSNEDWSNREFIRLVASSKRFYMVDFSQSRFNNCYLTACVFENCCFTGSHFISSNLRNSNFINCRFDYTTFERTIVDPDILDHQFLNMVNLRKDFARSLRTNYQQMGDNDSANRAIQVELDSTKIHLFNGWTSETEYYRNKYGSVFQRLKMFSLWLKFKALDWLWGNGEKISRVVIAIMLYIFIIAIVDLSYNPNHISIGQVFKSVAISPNILFSVDTPDYIPKYFATLTVAIRYILLALFVTILIKRLDRR